MFKILFIFFFFLVSRIEETWRLWQKFLDDYSRFEEWLKTSERTAALPNSSGVLYTVAKEELKKFEVCLFHTFMSECGLSCLCTDHMHTTNRDMGILKIFLCVVNQITR